MTEGNQPVTVRLPRTRTHSYRTAQWVPVQPGVGIMTIHEGNSRRSLKMTGRYLVKEHEPTYCRRFRVVKEGSENSEYWCAIAANKQEDACDCQGFESQALCKHSDGIRALVDAGVIGERNSKAVSSFSEDLDYLIGDVV